MGIPLPKFWIRVRATLENNPQNYIAFDDYRQRCTHQEQQTTMGNTINQFGSGDNIGGDKVMGDKIGTQVNQSQDLAQAAQDIKALLDQLSADYDTTSPSGQMMVTAKAVEAVEKNPTLKKRVVGALKGAGEKALEEAIDHPVAKVFVAGAKGFIQP